MKVVIATPFYNGQAHTPYVSSLAVTLKALTMAKMEWDYYDLTGDSYVDRARNTLCARFLKSDFTDLVFIDSDMSWNVDGFVKLLASPYEITGGSYPAKNMWPNYTAKMVVDPVDNVPMGDVEHGLIEAEWLPGGFLRIKRSALEKMAARMPDNWYWSTFQTREPEKHTAFFECQTIDHERQGEDVAFCKRWREMGGRLWIEPHIDFGHFGMREFKGNLDLYLRQLKDQEKIREELFKITKVQEAANVI